MSFWKSLSRGFIADSLTKKDTNVNVSNVSGSRIVVNGQVYSGTNVNVVNGRVIVSGKDVTPESKTIHIAVEGNIENLTVDACTQITVDGDVGELHSGAGNVNCGDTGFVKTGSGDVTASTITGSVKTGSGDINYKFNK